MTSFHHRVRVAEIAQIAAEEAGVSVSAVFSARADRKVARPRQIAMYVARTRLNAPDALIGRVLDRDHATVAAGCRRIEGLIEGGEPSVIALVARVEARLSERIAA
jgi:chromosomal replication initiator protein